jgi:hypothetical protein
MNILKKTVLAGMMVGVCTSFSFADSLVLTGEVPAISSVSFTPGMHLSDNLQSAILNNFSIGQIQIDNNDPQGFSLTLSSTNGSKLIRSGQTSSTAGNTVGYTVNFASGTGILGTAAGDATLGATVGTLFAGVNHTLAETAGTPIAYYFDQSVVTATVAKKYSLTMVLNSGAAASHLFNTAAGSEVYTDTILVTIANL